jgi:hypothetical protein
MDSEKQLNKVLFAKIRRRLLINTVRLNKFTVSRFLPQKHRESFLIEIYNTGNVQQNPATVLSERFTTAVLLRHAVSEFFPSRISDPDPHQRI